MAKRRAKGEGSIFKEKSGYWRAAVTFPDGAHKYKCSKRQSVVREWLQEQRQSIQRNILVGDDKILFGDYLDHFIDAVTKLITIFYGVNGVILILVFFDIVRTYRGWNIPNRPKALKEQDDP